MMRRAGDIQTQRQRIHWWLYLFLAQIVAAAGCLVPPPPAPPSAQKSSSKEADVVIARLTELRHERGLQPPKVMFDIEEMAADDGLALEKGECDADSALHRMLQKTLWKTDKGGNTVVRGWFFATNQLDQVGFPPPVLKSRVMNVAVVVVRHYKGDPDAYGVLLTAELQGDSLGAMDDNR